MNAVSRRPRFIVILCLAIVVIGAGAFLFGPRLFSSGNLPPAEDPPRAPVKWMEARQFFVEEWTEAIGTAQPLPNRAARVTAAVGGNVISVLENAQGKSLAEGEFVKKGDVIAQLDDRLAKAQRDKATAALDELKPLIKQAEHAVTVASIDVKRLNELSPTSSGDGKSSLISRFEMQKAQVVLEEAESKLKAVHLHEVTAQKELQILEEQLKLYTLVAPIDGRLGQLFVVQGQTLAAGAHVADIINVEDRIDVFCFVPPRVAKRLKSGQPARLGGVEDPPQENATTQGKVEFIADQAEPDTGNIAVKIRFPNKELGLRANTTLRLRVLTNPGKACLTLPESALFEDEDPPTVLVVEDYVKVKIKEGTKEEKEIEAGKARKLQVKLGIRDRVLHLVEIVSVRDSENQWQGTLQDAKFIVERGRGLRNGDLIQLQVDED